VPEAPVGNAVSGAEAVRLRPSGYGATAFAWLAEPKLTLDVWQA